MSSTASAPKVRGGASCESRAAGIRPLHLTRAGWGRESFWVGLSKSATPGLMLQQVSRSSLDDCLHPAGSASHHHLFRDSRMRNSVHVIAFIVVFALLVAAVGRGVRVLILARRWCSSLRSLLGISTDSPLLSALGSVATLVESATSRH